MHNSANFAGTSKGALHTQLVIMLKHCFFLFIKNEYYSVQASNFFLSSMEQRPEFVSTTLGGQIIYFIYKNCQMVGVKITVACYGHNNRIFGILFLADFLFSSLTTPNVFIVMVLKCTY